MTTLDKSSIQYTREVRYRRRMELRVTTPQQAASFVDDVGFCFLFPIQKVEMPSLWDAIAGRIIHTSPKHRGYEIERTWGWKDESLGKKWWYYGKLIRGRATLVSLKFLPNFYALSANYGDYQTDYLDEYREGQLSAEAKTIYEVLLERGALHAIELRREAHMSSDSSKSRFERALTELQVGLKVLPVGIAEAGAWRYAFIYDIVARWLPEVPERARAISRTQARAALLEQYIANVIASTPQAAARVFGWTLSETRQSAETLATAGKVRLDVRIRGLPEPQWIAAHPSRQ